MTRLRVYLAGPDVFRPDAVEHGRRLVALCNQHGFDAVFPLDATLPGELRDPQAIARHISKEAAAFVHAVFSLNDPNELQRLLTEAGFTSISTRVHTREIHFPPAREFMWQYIACTPLMTLLPKTGNAQTEALERDVVAQWQRWATEDGMRNEQSCVFSIARRG